MAEVKAVLFTDGKFQGMSNSGEVVPYGKLYFYDADSGNAITTYTTSTMETENTHPIILSASGKADVYTGDGKFNVTLQDKNSTTVWTINDYIPPGGQIQLDPITSTSTVEERTGITGTTMILENLPTTKVNIHKNGLLLLETDYDVENKVVVFDVALIASDDIVIKYGQLSEGQVVRSEWVYQDLIFTYVSSSSFKTNGDTTSVYLAERRVKINLLASSSYAEVVSSSYHTGNDETTVVVSTTAMDNTLNEIGYAIVSPYLGAAGGSISYYSRAEVDAFAVKLTGDQTVAGIKTFSSFPITPSSAPSTDYQTSNKKYVDDKIAVEITGMLSTDNLFHIQDQKPSGVDGGTFPSGTWQDRDFNTALINNITGASFDSILRTFELPVGSFIILADAPATGVDGHSARIKNITDTIQYGGTSGFNNSADSYSNGTSIVITPVFTIASPKTFKLQHLCGVSRTAIGFGRASVVADEIYSNIRIWKVG